MDMTLRWYGEGNDSVTLDQIRQIPGVTGVITALHDIPAGEAWTYEDVMKRKQEVEAKGLKLVGVESINVHEDIKIGLPTRDELIENYCKSLEAIGKADIHLVCYNFIRISSFGLHATKSWICLVSSLLIFIILPFICTVITIPMYLKIIIGLIGLAFIIKNAPADTYKRPIISKKRRMFFKICSSIVTIAMILFSLFIEDQFLANSLLFSIILQCFMISPTVYKFFKLPYNNYKRYI